MKTHVMISSKSPPFSYFATVINYGRLFLARGLFRICFRRPTRVWLDESFGLPGRSFFATPPYCLVLCRCIAAWGTVRFHQWVFLARGPCFVFERDFRWLFESFIVQALAQTKSPISSLLTLLLRQPVQPPRCGRPAR